MEVAFKIKVAIFSGATIYKRLLSVFKATHGLVINEVNIDSNHKNHIFLDCDWFKNSDFLQFTCQVIIEQFNKPITFKVVV